MALEDWQGRPFAFAIATYLLITIVEADSRVAPTQKRIDVTLSVDGRPAANAGIRLLLVRTLDTSSCERDDRYSDSLIIEGVADNRGKLELDPAPVWESSSANRRSGDRDRIVKLCVRDAGTSDWRAWWTAGSSDVNRRVLMLSCDLRVNSSVTCRHQVSSDLDTVWRKLVLPILRFVLFIVLMALGTRDGTGRVWACLFLASALNLAANVSPDTHLARAQSLTFASASALLAGFVLLGRLKQRSTTDDSWHLPKIRGRRNPF